MNRTCYRREIDAAAKAHGLDPDLVESLVLVESSGYASAFRYESAFFQKYQAPKTEWAFALQNPLRYGSSYGLLQIMVAVAREVGFQQYEEPEHLFIPRIGLEMGCRKFAELVAWAQRTGPTMSEEIQLRAAIAAYNGGHLKNEPDFTPDRNAAYAEKVYRIYTRPM